MRPINIRSLHMLKSFKAISLSISLILGLTVVSAAQTSSHTLSGVVKDPANAPVPAATINLLNGRQFSLASTQSDAQGRFALEAGDRKSVV